MIWYIPTTTPIHSSKHRYCSTTAMNVIIDTSFSFQITGVIMIYFENYYCYCNSVSRRNDSNTAFVLTYSTRQALHAQTHAQTNFSAGVLICAFNAHT
jgi:hypothetical protein